jgi:NAD(P)-dependent dehydrogenase (short-subunit alcohol dehydrogenase family)
MRLKLEEEQVLMGASSGIGRQTALRFTKRDARVVVSARSEGELNSQVEEIPLEGFPRLSGIAEEEKITRVARRGRPPSCTSADPRGVASLLPPSKEASR